MVIDLLTRGLAQEGHDVLLVTTGDSRCPVDRSWVYDQGRIDRIGDVSIELRHLLHAYDQIQGADVVHDHTLAGPVFASLRQRLPVVTTNHGPFDDEAHAIYRSIGHRVAIVAISHHQASTAVDVPISRVIHHGVDVGRYRVGPGGDRLVFLGRMSPTKGVREAAEIALRSGVPLSIAAKLNEPAEQEYFAAEIEPLLGDGVEYVGEVGFEEKLELLGSALALLNPIRWDEPFGLCMVEALACGTPVIATPRGAAPEIVDHEVTGYLARDADGLVEAIGKVGALDRRACRVAAETRFSAQRMTADHVALFLELLGTPSRSRGPRPPEAPAGLAAR
jgi:glycosyltransferase involved in cell wall biosynthesis